MSTQLRHLETTTRYGPVRLTVNSARNLITARIKRRRQLYHFPLSALAEILIERGEIVLSGNASAVKACRDPKKRLGAA